MRKGILVAVIVVAGIALFALTYQHGEVQPCLKLVQLCEGAGFKRGQSAQERKSFFQSCMRPLMQRGFVGDIQINQEDASACRQRFQKRRRSIGQDQDA